MCTSGPATGMAADIKKIEMIKSVLNEGKQMALASGVSIKNVGPCLQYVDYFVVASSVETHSMSGILVAEKVKELADKIHSY